MNHVRRYLGSWPYRVQCALGLALCGAMLGYALYVEHGMFMMPCPLCILQRMAVVGMALGFLAGLIVGDSRRWARRAAALWTAFSAFTGAGLAVWHLRIQSLPPSELSSCTGMDIGYLWDAFPWQDVLRKVFAGSADCAKVDWTLLGLSMPAWTLACFVAIGAAVLWADFRRRR